ncbi:hypothetical protein FP2506_08076 [Fulvimarina pelagi HTCC2506]|uniref:Uncharacterized protein n=1 Tax=Fulvimarina pelagi HTCC2506 TaxID=314231 RepID=Q0G6D1_9HYPH|nr:hypothetical protein FP2506_08076 [Fulvimarina pelagi HTCC2506]
MPIEIKTASEDVFDLSLLMRLGSFA